MEIRIGSSARAGLTAIPTPSKADVPSNARFMQLFPPNRRGKTYPSSGQLQYICGDCADFCGTFTEVPQHLGHQGAALGSPASRRKLRSAKRCPAVTGSASCSREQENSTAAPVAGL